MKKVRSASGGISIKYKSEICQWYNIEYPEKILGQVSFPFKSKLYYYLALTYSDTYNISLSINKNNEIILTQRDYNLIDINENKDFIYLINEPKKTFAQIKDFLCDFFVGMKGWKINNENLASNIVIIENPNAQRRCIVKPRNAKPKNAYEEYCERIKNQPPTVHYTEFGVPEPLEPFDYTATRTYREEQASRRGTFGVMSNEGYPSKSTNTKKENDK